MPYFVGVKVHTLIIILVFVLAVFFASYFYQAGAECQATDTKTLLALPREQALTLWHHCIDAVGGKEAYEFFAKSVAGAMSDEQHRAAHVFARALYEKLGTKALVLCDSRFDYACFHEIVASAVFSRGAAVALELLAACDKGTSDITLAWACRHGIGHGLIVQLGYTEPALKEALSICKQARPNRVLDSCYNGALMEYNQRSMGSGETRPFRGDVIEPCDSLAREYVPACFYRLPKWWRYTLLSSASTTRLFVQVGEWCRVYAANAIVRDGCFAGLGRLAGTESKDKPLRARELCDLASSVERDRFNCRSLAANVIAQVAPTEDAAAACDGLSATFKTQCLDWAHLPESLQDTDHPTYMTDSL